MSSTMLGDRHPISHSPPSCVDQSLFNVGRFSEEGDYEAIHAGNDANVEDALVALAAKLGGCRPSTG
jgi:hypothetical protein